MIQKLKRIVSDALWHDCKQCIRGFLRGHVDLLESPVFINVGNPVDKNIELKILSILDGDILNFLGVDQLLLKLGD